MLTAFLLLAPVVLLVFPRHIYPVILGLFVPTYVAIVWLATRPVATDDDWAWLGRAIVTLLIVAALAACGMRAGIAYLASKYSEREAEPLEWFFFQLSCALTIAISISWVVAPLLARLIGPGQLLFLSGILVLTGLSWVNLLTDRKKRIFVRSLLGVMILGMVAQLIWPPKVIAAAEKLAGERPYCLMVADGWHNHRPARTWFDLTPLIMNATKGRQSARNNHAQIRIKGASSMHWSYMNKRFEGYADLYQPRNCKQQVHFARHLPLF